MPAETAVVDTLSRALGLPRPFLHEENRAFVTVEAWPQLAAALASQPVAVRPRGYYRTPDSVDIYVFDIRMGVEEDAKSWRIYRRYRQFHKYVSSSSELLGSMVVPRLSQAYLKLFSAQTCAERLEELHAWLQGVVDTTQAFCRQQAAGSSAAASAPTKGSTPTARDPKTHDPKTQETLKPADGDGDGDGGGGGDGERAATFFRLRMDSVEARPLLLLGCFLLAGANCPFPHYFRGLPRFALAMEEINVELKPRGDRMGTGAGTGARTRTGTGTGTTMAAAVPSRVRSSLPTRAGLGLRLVPSHEQDGSFLGATVGGFSRELRLVDPRLARVPVGARLVRVNGVDTTCERFEAVLGMLSASGRRPLRLRFEHNPFVAARTSSDVGPTVPDARDAPAALSAAGDGAKPAASADDATLRSYSVDAPRQSASLLGSVLGDLFGRKRVDSADQALADRRRLQALDDARASWDDAGGEFLDILSRGFFTPLPPALLQELRDRRRRRRKLVDGDVGAEVGGDEQPWTAADPAGWDAKDAAKGDAGVNPAAVGMGMEKPRSQPRSRSQSQPPPPPPPPLPRRARGVWSTATGALALCLGACRVCGKEAAMLEHSPAALSPRPMGSEKRLRKGFVLVAINSESTFGWSFARVAAALATAPRPTSLAFRWFRDYSPFLESDHAENADEDEEGERGDGDWDEDDMLAAGPDGAAEALADLSASLHLALVENASVRDAVAALESAARETRVKLAAAERAAAGLEAKLKAKSAEVARLEAEGLACGRQLDRWRERATSAEDKVSAARQEAQAAVERARADVSARLAAEEERLVRESNRSIANANALAERKTQKLLDATVLDMQRRHDEYLQKLAEEHSEEVESLMQQVAVWRHQVEVLTEAEKRNYAALVHNGINPYGGARRSRFGGDADPDAHDADAGPGGFRGSPAAPTASHRRAAAQEPARGSRASSSSSGASQSQAGTFWDRMVSLLAAD